MLRAVGPFELRLAPQTKTRTESIRNNVCLFLRHLLSPLRLRTRPSERVGRESSTSKVVAIRLSPQTSYTKRGERKALGSETSLARAFLSPKKVKTLCSGRISTTQVPKDRPGHKLGRIPWRVPTQNVGGKRSQDVQATSAVWEVLPKNSVGWVARNNARGFTQAGPRFQLLGEEVVADSAQRVTPSILAAPPPGSLRNVWPRFPAQGTSSGMQERAADCATGGVGRPWQGDGNF